MTFYIAQIRQDFLCLLRHILQFSPQTRQKAAQTVLQKSGYAHGLTKKLIDFLKSALTYQLYFYYLNMASKPGAFHPTFTG